MSAYKHTYKGLPGGDCTTFLSYWAFEIYEGKTSSHSLFTLITDKPTHINQGIVLGKLTK